MSEIEPHFILTNCNINIITGIRRRNKRIGEIKDCDIQISGIVLHNSQSEQILIKNIESKFSILEGIKLMDCIYEKMAYSFTNLTMTADLDSLFTSKNFNKVVCDGCRVSITRVNNILYNNIPLIKIVKDKDMRMWVARSKKICEILNIYDSKVNLMLPEKFLQNYWEKIVDSQITSVQKPPISNTKTTNTQPVSLKPKKQKYDQILEFMEQMSNEKTEQEYNLKERSTIFPSTLITHKSARDNIKEVISDKVGNIEIRVDDSSTVESSVPLGTGTHNNIQVSKGHNLVERLRRIKEEQILKSNSSILEVNEFEKEENEIIKKKDLTKMRRKELMPKTGVDKSKKKDFVKIEQPELNHHKVTTEEENKGEEKIKNQENAIKEDKMYITNRNKYRRLPEKYFVGKEINFLISEGNEKIAHIFQGKKVDKTPQTAIINHIGATALRIEQENRNIASLVTDKTKKRNPHINRKKTNEKVFNDKECSLTNDEKDLTNKKTQNDHIYPLDELIKSPVKEIMNGNCITNYLNETGITIESEEVIKKNTSEPAIHSNENIRDKPNSLKTPKKNKRRKSYF